MYIVLQQIDKKMYHGQMIKSYEKDLTQQSAEAAQKKEYYSKFTASLAHTLEDLNDQNFGNKDKKAYAWNNLTNISRILLEFYPKEQNLSNPALLQE